MKGIIFGNFEKNLHSNSIQRINRTNDDQMKRLKPSYSSWPQKLLYVCILGQTLSICNAQRKPFWATMKDPTPLPPAPTPIPTPRPTPRPTLTQNNAPNIMTPQSPWANPQVVPPPKGNPPLPPWLANLIPEPTPQPTDPLPPTISPRPTIEPTTPRPTFSPTNPLPPVRHKRMSYLDRPRIKWTWQLPGGFEHVSGPSLRKGNAVVISPQGDRLYITSDDGRLFVKNINFDWDKGAIYTPERISVRGKQWHLLNFYGVSVHRNEEDKSEFAVYSVVDAAPKYLTDPLRSQSRVISVDHRGNHLWTTTITGTISGTPVISSNGRFVYVTHNAYWSEDLPEASAGHFSILDASMGGALYFTEPVHVYRHAREEHADNWVWKRPIRYYGGSPYGPIAKHNKPNRQESVDVLFWGENARNGYGSEGALHRVTVNGSTGSVRTEIVDLTRGYTVSTAPVIADGASKVYMTSANSTLFGWFDVKNAEPFSLEKKRSFWKTRLDKSQRNQTATLTSKPVLDLNGQRLYVQSAGTSFNCLSARSGEVLWTNPPGNSTSVSLVEAKISPGNDRVYTIQHLDGRVTAQNALTGRIIWEFSCFDVKMDPFCQDSVSADFALSPDGQTLYYGDIYGKIIALSVARQTESTGSPTKLPTVAPSSIPSIYLSDEPSPLASEVPTMVPSSTPSDLPSLNPTKQPSSRPSTSPSLNPSLHPSINPSLLPSENPTLIPSSSPSKLPTLIPSQHPSSFPSAHPSIEPSSQPTPYFGILVLKSVSPEGQVAVVSFVGMSSILAVMGMAFAFLRKRKAALYLASENGDEDVNDTSAGAAHRDLSIGSFSITKRLRNKKRLRLGATPVPENSEYNNASSEETMNDHLDEVAEEEEESYNMSSDGVDSLQAVPPIFHPSKEKELTTWSMTSEGAVLTEEEEHMYGSDHFEDIDDQTKSLTSV